MKKINKKAFTLIELLVVVLIIGILAAIAVPQYQKAVLKSRVSELLLLAKNIKNEQEIFYLENGRYATGCTELNMSAPSGYVLDEDEDTFENQDKKFYLDCNRGARYSTDDERIAAMYYPSNSEVLSIEMKFDKNTRGSLKACYTNADYMKHVCNNLCGVQLAEDESSCLW